MSFTLSEAVPWGRSFEEYVAMFALGEADLAKTILGCADGPASFNARLTRRGGSIISADPLYRWQGAEIRGRIRQATPAVLEHTRSNMDKYVWERITSIEHLEQVRHDAMNEFLADYEEDGRERYVDASLPSLPFLDGQFDLALCSHFIFLYSEQHSLEFHVASMIELCRVAREVRVFPLIELSVRPSRHLDPVRQSLRARGFDVSCQRVPYEFVRGANEMLIVRQRPA